MSNPNETPIDLRQAELEALRFHEQGVADAADLWRDGLNILLRGFDVLNGHTGTTGVQATQLGFLILALQTLARSLEEGVRGYYPQSLNLLRTPLEYAVAYWYLDTLPEDHELFTDLSKRTPPFNDMVQRLESKRGKGTVSPIKDWMKKLHPFSHVDRSVVNIMIRRGPVFINYAVGPQHDEWLFRFCTDQAVGIVGFLLGELDHVRRVMGYEPLPLWREYIDRQEAWRKAQIRRDSRASAV